MTAIRLNGGQRGPVRDLPVGPAVGAYLANIRHREAISQREVAQAMGTQQSHVSDIESGDMDPRVSTIVRYLVAVGKAAGRRDVHSGCAGGA